MGQLPPTLPTLPTETVENIAGNLAPTDLLALRPTCRLLDQKVVQRYAAVLFTTVRTNCGSHSLQKVEGISQSEHLRHHVKKLVIDCQTNEKGLDPELFGPLYLEYLADLSHLQECVRKLQHILSTRLINCRSFSFDSQCLDCAWSQNILQPDDAIYILISIITQPKCFARSLELDFEHVSGLDSERLAGLRQSSSLREALAHTQELNLVYTDTFSGGTIDLVKDVIKFARHLSILSFRTVEDFRGSFFKQYVKYGGGPSSLRELVMNETPLDVRSFQQFLASCNNRLRKIELLKITIPRVNNQWTEMLRYLRDECPSLESIEIDSCFISLHDMPDPIVFDDVQDRLQAAESLEAPVLTHSCHRPLREEIGNKSQRWYMRGRVNVTYPEDHTKSRFAVAVQYEGTRVSKVLTAIAESSRIVLGGLSDLDSDGDDNARGLDFDEDDEGDVDYDDNYFERSGSNYEGIEDSD